MFYYVTLAIIPCGLSRYPIKGWTARQVSHPHLDNGILYYIVLYVQLDLMYLVTLGVYSASFFKDPENKYDDVSM